ncbi:MAG: hypothetical protein AB7V18_19505 [Pyrinomonadaceae bacterium]
MEGDTLEGCGFLGKGESLSDRMSPTFVGGCSMLLGLNKDGLILILHTSPLGKVVSGSAMTVEGIRHLRDNLKEMAEEAEAILESRDYLDPGDEA